ncbi:hypothetical protein FRC10_008326 [Ceratobasidium sp. 414]|nr:hypothetical protein FRC10_008326 [Ceratobasidium sp. 414]
MPTENIAVLPAHPFEATVLAPPPQIKLCSTCHGPLADTVELVFTLGHMGPDDICTSPGVVCSACAERTRVSVHERVLSDPPILPGARMRRLSTLEPMVEEPSAESDGETASSGHPHTPPPDARPTRAGVLAPLCIPSRSPVRTQPPVFALDAHSLSSRAPHSVAMQHRPRSLTSPSPPLSLGTPPPTRPDPSAFDQELDPFADVTRLRLKNTRQDCLYPGASFVGIQKSGRNSYNVSVTIVNVDFPGSTLCGYLTIENLTDDHPQLTTYFDAEIIGPKYGFLTQGYGASETDDITHWGRFDSFRGIKAEMRRPGLTIRQKSLAERGFVFMRWKERFLVPDHQVRGIRGASYDGNLNSQAESPVHTHSPFREPTSPVQTYHPIPSQQTAPAPTPAPPPPTRTRTMSSASTRSAGPMSPEVLQSTDEFPPLSPSPRQPPAPTSPPSPRVTRAHSSSFRSNSGDTWGGGGRGTSTRTSGMSATMTGFYFHQNSEPYVPPAA